MYVNIETEIIECSNKECPLFDGESVFRCHFIVELLGGSEAWDHISMMRMGKCPIPLYLMSEYLPIEGNSVW